MLSNLVAILASALAYLGAGWIVAVVRDIQQAVPVSGNFVGGTDAFAGMSVEVVVTL